MKKYLFICNILKACISSILFLVAMQFYGGRLNCLVFNLSIIIFIFILFILKVMLNIRYWEYAFDDEKIIYVKGFYSITKTIIPLMRIQQVVTINNPLLNKYSLVKLSIITTTKTHTLLPIAKCESDEIINYITKYLQKNSGFTNEL